MYTPHISSKRAPEIPGNRIPKNSDFWMTTPHISGKRVPEIPGNRILKNSDFGIFTPHISSKRDPEIPGNWIPKNSSIQIIIPHNSGNWAPDYFDIQIIITHISSNWAPPLVVLFPTNKSVFISFAIGSSESDLPTQEIPETKPLTARFSERLIDLNYNSRTPISDNTLIRFPITTRGTSDYHQLRFPTTIRSVSDNHPIGFQQPPVGPKCQIAFLTINLIINYSLYRIV